MIHGNHFDFHVKDGKVHLSSFKQYESRGECCLELFCDLVTNWPELLNDCRGTVYYGDEPPPSLREGQLNLCTTLTAETRSNLIPFPCFSFLRYPEIGIRDAESMLLDILSDMRPFESSKIFWIGAESNRIRRKLVDLSSIHPSVLDASMMSWDRNDPKNLKSAGKFVSVPDHRKYKYLIDCPGRGYSVRLKWLIATGRPVFLVDRRVREPWELDLIPWLHYIPVAADLSDLLQRYQELESDPDLYSKISESSRAFAAERLSVEMQLIRCADALRGNLKP